MCYTIDGDEMKKNIHNRIIFAMGIIAILLISGVLVQNFRKNNTNDNPKEEIVEKVAGQDILEESGLSEEEVKAIISLNNYRPSLAKRYADYTKASTPEQRVMEVNCDMDLEPYSTTQIIEDDSDVTLLVNKFHSLPEGYKPNDLVVLKEHACVQGIDYSCQAVDQMELRKEAYDAYLKFCEEAMKHDLEIRAIAGYRTYDYQKMLWDYNADIYGNEYADQYFARPGQSEHNTGLAIDITFNGHNYNEIENADGYAWILENMHNYGFILRYPESKTNVTRYGYESWHIRYVGLEAAKEIVEHNWTLEEYYGAKK